MTSTTVFAVFATMVALITAASIVAARAMRQPVPARVTRQAGPNRS